jgi:DNA-directed RNA polymerase subunit N (RpoN/RPB10)
MCAAAAGGAARPMLLPVRCYTCGAVVAHRQREYAALLVGGARPAEALAAIGATRMCCRRMYLGHVDLTTQEQQYPAVDRVMDEGGTVLRRESRGEHVVACD